MSGLLWAHSLLRWFIIVFLIINIARHFIEKDKPYTELDKRWSFRLLLITHLNVVIGLIQYFFGDRGFAFVKTYGMGEVMKNSAMRFWVVEHITGMLLAAVLITAANSLVKKYTVTHDSKHNRVFTFYVIALVVILAVIPWPFREIFTGTPWIRGLY